jgi:hypothetical protein
MSFSRDGWVRFAIEETDLGWAWSTHDYAGLPRSSGLAPSRALAAAIVLREIILLATPAAVEPALRQAA